MIGRSGKRTAAAVAMCILLCTLTGCKMRDRGSQPNSDTADTPVTENADVQQEEGGMTDVSEDEIGTTGWEGESASDGEIDFARLQTINPDIYAWIYVPGTRIDDPVCQNPDETFYEHTDAARMESTTGAVFTEMANLRDMCDFNTVLHAPAEGTESLFSDLTKFLDPAFFDRHEIAYIYIEGNVLTYELFAAYRRENTSLLRLYDFTYEEGCRDFITDLMGARDISTQFRTGYEDLNPYNFLITLTGHTNGTASEGNEISLRLAQGDGTREAKGEQIVVLGILTSDAAGTIDRDMTAADLYYELLNEE